MKLIKIINGTYGFRPQPYVVEPKTPDDPPFEVSDEEAERLVGLGVAVVAFGEDSPSLQEAMDDVVKELDDQPVQPEDDEEPAEDGEEADEEELGDMPSRAELEEMTVTQLNVMAKSLGVRIPARAKKAVIVNIILEAAAEEDELPDLGAADPEA